MCVPQDEVYLDCDGAHAWDTMKAALKISATAKGCAGATQAMPAVFLATAAVRRHPARFCS